MATPIPENRARFRLGEIAAATGGRLIDLDPGREIAGVTTDSRAAPAGSLFVALVGESQDGHRFVDAARAGGALALVAAGRGVAGARIEVGDTLVALGDLARAFVDRETAGRPLPTLAIGGAAGKTTPKALAAAAVEALFGPTLVTAGNLNNRIGVPMTLLTLAPGQRAAVLECGTSVPGEIAELGRIVRPDVALVLNVDVEHSERLGGLEAIADEEAELLLAARRVAVTSESEPLLVERLGRVAVERRLFGASPRADLRLVGRSVDGAASARLSFRLGARFAGRPEGARLQVSTGLLGPSAAANIAAALAGALALLGRPPSASELAALGAALGAVEAVPGRLRPVAGADGRLVLDDTYNANPRSVRAALDAAREIAARRPGGRLLIVLGDMLELGELAPAAHDAALRAADAAGAARLILVGPELAAAAARAAPATPTDLCADADAAAIRAAGIVGPRDLVLVKGSRGIRTERVVAALLPATAAQAS